MQGDTAGSVLKVVVFGKRYENRELKVGGGNVSYFFYFFLRLNCAVPGMLLENNEFLTYSVSSGKIYVSGSCSLKRLSLTGQV